MRTRQLRRALLGLAALALALGIWGAAQAQGDYTIGWWVIAGGGGSSTGGAYALAGTGGQNDAGHQSGGAYTLSAGYWTDGAASAGPATTHLVYLPTVANQGGATAAGGATPGR